MALKIGELARAAGAKAETIRYYETIGLMGPATRSEGNYRLYGPEHLNRLSFIRRARGLGFSIDEVRQLLTLSENRETPCEAIDDLARAQREAIDRKIADLTALRRELDALIEACPAGAVADCRIIEALSPV